MLAQRRRSNTVQMLYKCFVFAGLSYSMVCFCFYSFQAEIDDEISSSDPLTLKALKYFGTEIFFKDVQTS